MRVMTTATRTATEQREVRWALLVAMGFDAGPVYFTNAPITITFGNQEYLGGGRMLDIKLPREDGSMAAHKGSITLDGLDGAAISMAFNERTEGIPMHVRMALWDKATGALIGDILIGRYALSEVRVTPPTSAESGASA